MGERRACQVQRLPQANGHPATFNHWHAVDDLATAQGQQANPGKTGLVGEARADSQPVAKGARVATVMGVGGVGKTRLLQASREWVVLDMPEVDIWQGRAYETGRRLPYEPVIEALRLCLEQENAPEDLLEDAWLVEVSQLMPELRGR